MESICIKGHTWLVVVLPDQLSVVSSTTSSKLVHLEGRSAAALLVRLIRASCKNKQVLQFHICELFQFLGSGGDPLAQELKPIPTRTGKVQAGQGSGFLKYTNPCAGRHKTLTRKPRNGNADVN